MDIIVFNKARKQQTAQKDTKDTKEQKMSWKSKPKAKNNPNPTPSRPQNGFHCLCESELWNAQGAG